MMFGIRREAAPYSGGDQNAASIGNWNVRRYAPLWVAGALTLGLLAGCSASSGNGAGSGSASASSGGSLFTTTGNAFASGGTGGQVIAELQLSIPGTTEFILRGTIPVPKGTYPLRVSFQCLAKQ